MRTALQIYSNNLHEVFMRKSDLVIDALFLTLYQILACLALYAVAWLFTKIADRFIEVGFFATNLIYTLILGIGMAVLLWIYAYKMTYRTVNFTLTASIITSAIAVVIHLFLSAVFNYSAAIAGMALPLSGIIVYGTSFSAPESRYHFDIILYLLQWRLSRHEA